ncbi:hypothetical protein [Pseudomonas sp. PNPG3]|uniref:hypothetical protein n=1 Tax=Pseudomonas sp. PNPG3 TaxID=2919497 RepID=UPI001FFCAF27|nr:hypothetical protein [Pseudomonas sp. PNPG3]MCK2122059.1 hypothetical protein [Pseudomonas sp. PNPG3]
MSELQRDPAPSVRAIRALGMPDVFREQAESLLHNIFLAHEAGRMGSADAPGMVREAKGRGTGFALGLQIGNRIDGNTSRRLTEVFRAAADDDLIEEA